MKRLCPICQAEIPENSPQQLCPKCLMMFASEETLSIDFDLDDTQDSITLNRNETNSLKLNHGDVFGSYKIQKLFDSN